MPSDIELEQRTLHTYELLAAKSEAMLDAARRSDWHAVTAIEADCDRLMQSFRGANVTSHLDKQTRQRRAELMHRIVATDAAIRELSQPWAAKLAHQLRLHGGAERTMR